MLGRICLVVLLALVMMTSASEARSRCKTTPFKECKGKVAYACVYNELKLSGGGFVCKKTCNKDHTGGFGPC